MLDALHILEKGEALVHRDHTTIDSSETTESRGLFLRVVTGESAYEVALPPGTYVVGRGRDADIRVDRPGISRAHFRLSVGEHVILEDLGSANGTRVAGSRIASRAKILLAAGIPVEMGDAVALLRHGVEDGANERENDNERVFRRIARTELPVLVSGEAGTGKGHAARRIHELSPRAGGPFLALDCATLRFARTDPTPALLSARGGTLLLDEVSELDPPAQAVILDALRQVDKYEAPRITATCGANIEQLLASGAFRTDLYHRLAQLTYAVPALRTRLDELPSLCAALLQEITFDAGITPPLLSSDALRVLSRYRWPGNMRELRTALSQALVSGGRVLTASHFGYLGAKAEEAVPIADPGQRTGSDPIPTAPRQRTLRDATEEAEHARILDALRLCSGNQTRAARILGISRGTLITRLDRYGIPRPRRS